MDRTLKPVRDISLKEPSSVRSIIDEMSECGGFVARHFAEGVNILMNMMNDPICVKFLSFPAAIVATGVRGVLKEMVKRRMVDVIITTAGSIDHDLARSWGDYYEGSWDLDDVKLLRRGFHRLGNILIPRDNYGILLEKKLQPFFEELYNKGIKEISSVKLCELLGSYVNNESSILYWAYKNRIPVIIPGLMDGAIGSQIWLFSQRRDLQVSILKDEQTLADIIFSAKRSGALIIGGGISKHHTLWWNQFKGGLDYVVEITTAVEYDGSLSGARVREAVSWGKVKPRANRVTIYGDATVLLPFMIAAILQR
ncbi:MAG: deoxyhypusine synthase [Nitrososphaerota archaeon]|nr:deoxyhypusine synthase [Nitrososphaerales archaeon]MDW8044227.1 deoxyhypusine synthase [Nitrososphaerota archaeon]